MPILSSSPSARVSLYYITGGALLETWSVIWYWWLTKYPPEREWVLFFCYGLMATGAILFVIGLSLGWIGRAARRAELPPPEVTEDAVQAEKNMAARAPVTAPNPAAGAYGGIQPVAPVAPVAAVPATPAVAQPAAPARRS